MSMKRPRIGEAPPMRGPFTVASPAPVLGALCTIPIDTLATKFHR
jgi:hypothetical protein